MRSEVTILLVDDDDVDIMGLRRGFQKAKVANTIVAVSNGVEALEVLRRPAPLSGTKPSYIVMLDLNMPRMGGIEFLEELRSDPAIAHTVVFVLTTSDDSQDRWAAYEKHISGYCLKSNAGSDFVQLVSMLALYWRVVELPD